MENPAGYVYNFVLDSCHVLLVDGIQCATWGHGLQEDVVRHAYYGSQTIIRDLSDMPGWTDGLVDIIGSTKNRQGEVTGLIKADSNTNLGSSMATSPVSTCV